MFCKIVAGKVHSNFSVFNFVLKDIKPFFIIIYKKFKADNDTSIYIR